LTIPTTPRQNCISSPHPQFSAITIHVNLHTQAGLILHNLLSRYFALKQLENLQHHSVLYDNFQFNMNWHRPAFLKLWSVDHKWSSGSALVVLLD